MVPVVVIMVDKAADGMFESARQIVVLEQDAVLERLVPALDLAMGHLMVWLSTNMIHVTLVQPRCQVAGDIG
jgi:hypothetical protein